MTMQTYTEVLEEFRLSIESFCRLAQKFEAAGDSWLAAKCRDHLEELRARIADSKTDAECLDQLEQLRDLIAAEMEPPRGSN